MKKNNRKSLDLLESLLYLRHNVSVLDGGCNPGFFNLVGDVPKEVAEDLATACLGQPLDDDDVVQLCECTNFLPDECLQFLRKLQPVSLALHHDIGEGHVATQGVVLADDGALGHEGVLS